MSILVVVRYDLSMGYVFVTRDNVGVFLEGVGYVFVTRDNVGVLLDSVGYVFVTRDNVGCC